jgi:hypothetical protein
MTDLPYVRSSGTALPIARRLSRWRISWTSGLDVAVLLAAGAGVIVAARAGDQTGSIEWQLALLMRFMVLVKAAMVIAAFALAHWRLRTPIGGVAAAGLVAATAMMALAPGLIWSMRHIVLGAACFHAGLIAYLVVAWRDGSVRLPARRA